MSKSKEWVWIMGAFLAVVTALVSSGLVGPAAAAQPAAQRGSVQTSAPLSVIGHATKRAAEALEARKAKPRPQLGRSPWMEVFELAIDKLLEAYAYNVKFAKIDAELFRLMEKALAIAERADTLEAVGEEMSREIEVLSERIEKLEELREEFEIHKKAQIRRDELQDDAVGEAQRKAERALQAAVKAETAARAAEARARAARAAAEEAQAATAASAKAGRPVVYDSPPSRRGDGGGRKPAAPVDKPPSVSADKLDEMGFGRPAIPDAERR